MKLSIIFVALALFVATAAATNGNTVEEDCEPGTTGETPKPKPSTNPPKKTPPKTTTPPKDPKDTTPPTETTPPAGPSGEDPSDLCYTSVISEVLGVAGFNCIDLNILSSVTKPRAEAIKEFEARHFPRNNYYDPVLEQMKREMGFERDFCGTEVESGVIAAPILNCISANIASNIVEGIPAVGTDPGTVTKREAEAKAIRDFCATEAGAGVAAVGLLNCIDTNVFSSIIEGADPTEGGEIPTKRTKPSRKSHAEVARAVTERERRRANMKKLIRRVVATRMCVTQTEAGVIGADVANCFTGEILSSVTGGGSEDCATETEAGVVGAAALNCAHLDILSSITNGIVPVDGPSEQVPTTNSKKTPNH